MTRKTLLEIELPTNANCFQKSVLEGHVIERSLYWTLNFYGETTSQLTTVFVVCLVTAMTVMQTAHLSL